MRRLGVFARSLLTSWLEQKYAPGLELPPATDDQQMRWSASCCPPRAWAARAPMRNSGPIPRVFGGAPRAAQPVRSLRRNNAIAPRSCGPRAGSRPSRTPSRPQSRASPLLAVATSVATSIPSNVSNASSKATNLDDLDARGSIYAPCARLRALWTLWSVEVRVLSGALEKPRTAGLFVSRATFHTPSATVGSCHVATNNSRTHRPATACGYAVANRGYA